MKAQHARMMAGTPALIAVAAVAILVMGQTIAQPADKEPPLPQRRVAVARLVYEQLVVEPSEIGGARASAEETHVWPLRWMEAEQAAASDRPTALAAAEAHLARMRELAQRFEKLHQAGQASAGQVAATKYYQVDAEWFAVKDGTN